MLFKIVKLWCFLFCIFFVFSCKKNDKNLVVQRGALVNAEKQFDIPLSEISSVIGDSFPSSLVKYGVKGYKITYGTIYDNEPIYSQALLLIPEGVNIIHLVAYFHGTNVPMKILGSEQKIPSNYDGSTKNWREVRFCGITLAMSGYCVLLPDYIGYGITADKEHPFIYYPELFKANIDALLATKRFFEQQHLFYDNRLFLAGWSQGAGASLSAQKYIEANYTDEFKVVASSNLAGPYNFTRFIFLRRCLICVLCCIHESTALIIANIHVTIPTKPKHSITILIIVNIIRTPQFPLRHVLPAVHF